MDPQAEESRAAVLLAFVNQAAPNIRKKLQKIEGLGKQTIQDLLKAAEKVFNNRETPEEREERIRREERELAEKIKKEDREHRAKKNPEEPEGASPDSFCGDEGWNRIEGASRPPDGKKERPKRQALKKDQCTYCKERGHWKNECPKRDQKRGTTQRERISPATRVLYVGEDSD